MDGFIEPEEYVTLMDNAGWSSHVQAVLPKCPSCQCPLVERAITRRFQEDNRFQECPNGHVWYLTSTFHA